MVYLQQPKCPSSQCSPRYAIIVGLGDVHIADPLFQDDGLCPFCYADLVPGPPLWPSILVTVQSHKELPHYRIGVSLGEV